MYKVIVFNPTNPTEATDFLNKKYDEGLEFITCQGCYYYFRKRKDNVEALDFSFTKQQIEILKHKLDEGKKLVAFLEIKGEK